VSQTVRADVARLVPPDDAPVDELVAGMRSFGLRLMASQPAELNLVVSPASIALAFAMVEAGAGSSTSADILRALELPAPPGLHDATNALSAQLAAVSHDDVTLDIANAIWGQVGLPLGAPFLATLASHHGAGVATADFVGDAEAARQEINRWVSDVTRERIPELFPPRMINADTMVALVNAVYLDAAWRTAFDEARTLDLPFTLTDGSSADVATMHNPRLSTQAAVERDHSAVQLPYQGGELAMVVVVPPESTPLAAFEASLTGERLAAIVAGLGRAVVDLALPRWDIGTALDLGPPLSALGLRIPGGDLGGMAPGALIGAAVHAANITVDEKRTVAAAATGVVAARTSMPPPPLRIAVDRPFLFVVLHEATGAPLFIGRVTDPRG
jgi:serpin B